MLFKNKPNGPAATLDTISGSRTAFWECKGRDFAVLFYVFLLSCKAAKL
jgi:hypothetical protein